jgi:hypothetical protein
MGYQAMGTDSPRITSPQAMGTSYQAMGTGTRYMPGQSTLMGTTIVSTVLGPCGVYLKTTTRPMPC